MQLAVVVVKGTPCISVDDEPPPKQQIMVSRSFGGPVTRGVDVAGTVTEFTSRAAEKLRSQQSAAGAIVVFIRTSPSRADDPQYSASVTVPLLRPTGDSALLVSAAIARLRGIYKTGFKYAKAGVMLVELQPQEVRQGELDFSAEPEKEPGGGHVVREGGAARAQDWARLMTAVEAVNARFGRGSLKLAGAGLAQDKQAWAMRHERRTPGYTTRWEEMPVVRA